MLSVKTLCHNVCNPWMKVVLPNLTKIIGQKQSKISTFYTPAETHRAITTASLAGQDTLLNPVLFQRRLLQDSFSEMRNKKLEHMQYVATKCFPTMITLILQKPVTLS